MTIREMHIEVNQSMQEVAANKTRKFLSEEIDWVLNKMLARFIQSRLRRNPNGSFTPDQVSLDSIRRFVRTKRVPAYIDALYPNRYEVALPGDYDYLVSDTSVASQLCGKQPVVKDVNEHVTWVKQPYSDKLNAMFYTTYTLGIDGQVLSIPADLPISAEYLGYSSKKDISFLVPYILDRMRGMLAPRGIDIVWERYRNEYRAGYYALISQASISVSMVMDGIGASLGIVQQDIPYKQQVAVGIEERLANRLESSENIQQMLGTAFYRPLARSPISEMQGNTLYIYSRDSCIISNCELVYVRKPRPMSLSLGSDCELAETHHQTICDLAVQYIYGRLQKGNEEQLIEHDTTTQVIL